MAFTFPISIKAFIRCRFDAEPSTLTISCESESKVSPSQHPALPPHRPLAPNRIENPFVIAVLVIAAPLVTVLSVVRPEAVH